MVPAASDGLELPHMVLALADDLWGTIGSDPRASRRHGKRWYCLLCLVRPAACGTEAKCKPNCRCVCSTSLPVTNSPFQDEGVNPIQDTATVPDLHRGRGDRHSSQSQVSRPKSKKGQSPDSQARNNSQLMVGQPCNPPHRRAPLFRCSKACRDSVPWAQ